MDRCRDAPSREWIARRRLWCIEQAETPRPVTDTFGDVHRAATELQKSMGLWQPDFQKNQKAFITVTALPIAPSLTE
ncbi:PerC family transcriptional regulator [Salmonella enterica]|nr:PerC family transcriptional regulator [Salmonella enterica]EKS5829913.1 PerC family transcriptional regulator [Salmonella enterica]EKS5881064.1 PerC family transcriptional regulator [Salmonella enterica]